MKATVSFGVLLLVLAGCGTPQERCIAAGTRDLRILTRLIGETEQNLKRGYALEEVTERRTRWQVCQRARPATATEPARRAEMCLKDYNHTEIRPRAINLADERQKLAEMQGKRRELERQAQVSIATCKQTHPE